MSRDVAAVQRAMARMLYDPAFVGRIYRGPVEGLTEDERALLTAVDRRAWGTDRFRRSRGVQALIEEYPVTASVLGVQGVDAFFSSEAFAQVLHQRGSMALAFGGWAAGKAGPVARLERAIARARRAEDPDGVGVVARPGLVPLSSPAGLLQAWSQRRAALGPDPVAALAQQRRPGRRLRSGKGTEEWLVERDPETGEVGVSGASGALVALLSFCATPQPRDAVLAEARRLGCDPGEDAELLAELLADSTLVEVGAERHADA